MPLEDSTHPQDWLRIAEKDLARVQVMLDADDPEAAGFYLQQSLEKYLKAFLLSKSWRLKRTHDLEVLLNDALRYDPSLEEFRGLCQEVTDFYIVARYPFTGDTGITDEDVTTVLAEAKRFIERLESQIK